MAYTKKTWKDRQSEHPTRRKLVPAGAENTYDVERSEGLIIEEGDPFDQKSMNDLEQRIADGFDESAVFSATFRLDGWTKSGSTWTQTVACTGMQANYSTSPVWVEKTGTEATDAALQDALSQLNDGLLQPLNGQLKATLPPSCDVKIFVRRRELQR